MATTQEINQRIAAFAHELAEALGEVDDSDALSWLDAIETQAVEIGDAISVELLRQRSADRPAADEESICPQCGKLGRYQGQRERELVGRRGAVTISEPEYFCPCCRKAFFPGDPSDRRGDRLPVHAGDAAEGGLRRRAIRIIRPGDQGPGSVG